MKWLFAGLLLIHGLIHLMGFAKAFGYAELPQLTQPISRVQGIIWLAAAALFLAALAALFVSPRQWWWIGVIALLVSQAAIIPSWADAKFGTLANVLVLAAVVFGFFSQGPLSLRAAFEKDVAAGLSRAQPQPILVETDLEALPAALRAYLLRVGAVGQPRVQNFHATFHGRIRSGPDAPWMTFSGEQYNFYDQPSRFFFMNAWMRGLPVEGFHRYVGPSATMRIKVASLFPMVDAEGPELTTAETVTLFNDMCVFAPATLVDPRIEWTEIDALHLVGRFTHESIGVEATLTFNDAGELVDFVSDDRLMGSPDGSSFARVRWSTPLRQYKSFGSVTLSSAGVGRWHRRGAEAYDYIEIFTTGIKYNLTAF